MYKQLRERFENQHNQEPDDPRFRTALGKVYAQLKQFEMAIQEGVKATELLPIRQDAYYGTIVRRDLVHISAICNRKEQAIDVLESFFVISSVIHRNKLRIHPDWDPLRDNPRFQELISGEDEPYLEGL